MLKIREASTPEVGVRFMASGTGREGKEYRLLRTCCKELVYVGVEAGSVSLKSMG